MHLTLKSKSIGSPVVRRKGKQK